MAIDDPALYIEHFGQPATLAGAAVRAVVDEASEVVLDDAIVLAPTAVVRSVPGAAAGQSFLSAGVAYTVRQVLRLPPDAALQRLILARA